MSGVHHTIDVPGILRGHVNSISSWEPCPYFVYFSQSSLVAVTLHGIRLFVFYGCERGSRGQMVLLRSFTVEEF